MDNNNISPPQTKPDQSAQKQAFNGASSQYQYGNVPLRKVSFKSMIKKENLADDDAPSESMDSGSEKSRPLLRQPSYGRTSHMTTSTKNLLTLAAMQQKFGVNDQDLVDQPASNQPNHFEKMSTTSFLQIFQQNQKKAKKGLGRNATFNLKRTQGNGQIDLPAPTPNDSSGLPGGKDDEFRQPGPVMPGAHDKRRLAQNANASARNLFTKRPSLKMIDTTSKNDDSNSQIYISPMIKQAGPEEPAFKLRKSGRDYQILPQIKDQQPVLQQAQQPGQYFTGQPQLPALSDAQSAKLPPNFSNQRRKTVTFAEVGDSSSNAPESMHASMQGTSPLLSVLAQTKRQSSLRNLNQVSHEQEILVAHSIDGSQQQGTQKTGEFGESVHSKSGSYHVETPMLGGHAAHKLHESFSSQAGKFQQPLKAGHNTGSSQISAGVAHTAQFSFNPYMKARDETQLSKLNQAQDSAADPNTAGGQGEGSKANCVIRFNMASNGNVNMTILDKNKNKGRSESATQQHTGLSPKLPGLPQLPSQLPSFSTVQHQLSSTPTEHPPPRQQHSSQHLQNIFKQQQQPSPAIDPRLHQIQLSLQKKSTLLDVAPPASHLKQSQIFGQRAGPSTLLQGENIPREESSDTSSKSLNSATFRGSDKSVSDNSECINLQKSGATSKLRGMPRLSQIRKDINLHEKEKQQMIESIEKVGPTKKRESKQTRKSLAQENLRSLIQKPRISNATTKTLQITTSGEQEDLGSSPQGMSRLQPKRGSRPSQRKSVAVSGKGPAISDIAPDNMSVLKSTSGTSQISKMFPQKRQKRSSIKNQQTCKCAKTKCLQLYCDCFAIGKVCDSRCQCKGCHNKKGFEQQIKKQRKQILSRNPMAFKSKVIEDEDEVEDSLFDDESRKEGEKAASTIQKKLKGEQPKGLKAIKKNIKNNQKCTRQQNITATHKVGCKCQKSNCQKNYCECFQMGLICNPKKCMCINCKNTIEEANRRLENDDFLREFKDLIT